MKKIIISLICTIFFFTCLKAKKSGTDINSPSGAFFAFGFSLSSGSETSTTTATSTSTSTSSSATTSYSVQGTITGFSSGTLILSLNNSNTLSLNGPQTSFSFTQALSSGNNYTVSITQHPTGLACTLSNATGTISSSNITNVNISCATSSVSAFYSSTDWMDYIKRDTPTTNSLSAIGTTCTGSETGWYNSCIHAGEIRAVTIPNLTSCSGITATDNLGVLNWTCNVSNSVVKVVSTGLLYNKNLSDLIDFTNVKWNSNFVSVKLNGVTFLTTATSSNWWNTPISVANSGLSGGISKNIYIVTTNSTSNYTINQNRVALVIKTTNIVTAPTGDTITISSNFNWIEGNYSATSGNGIGFSGTPTFNVFRNVNLTSSLYAINNSVCRYSYFYNIKIYNNGSGGINSNNPNNLFNGLNVYNISGDNLWLSNNDQIVINVITSAGSANGIAANTSSYNSNLIINATTVNNNQSGMNLSSALRTKTMNLASLNNSTNGITTSLSNNSEFINTISSNNVAEISDAFNSSPMSFNGILKVNSTCSVGGGSPGINGSCGKVSPSETTPPTVTGISINSSFVGKVTSDSANTVGASGTGIPSGVDWFTFQNSFRNWGISNVASFPGTVFRGKCSGPCQIWDWSLKNNDNIFRNVNSCPSGTSTTSQTWNTPYANQSQCDANYPGSTYTAGVCVSTFLRNAVEIFADGIGNDNGLCESNEDCMYTPNIGAYQGHGNLVTASTSSSTTNTCSDIGTGGTISTIKLWKWDTNGY